MRTARTRAARLFVVVATTVLLTVHFVRAQSDEPVHIEYSAAAGCPSEASFLGSLRARSLRIRVASRDERARVLVIRLTMRGPRAEGRLILRAEDGSVTERLVAGDTCGEVATAVALVAAVIVDPLATTSPAPTASMAPPASTTAPPASTTVPPASTTAPSLAVPPPPTAPASPALAPAPLRPLESSPTAFAPILERPGWHFTIGAGAAIIGGVSPGAVLGPSVFVETSRGSASLVAPEFRLRLDRASAGSEAPPGSAEFTWTAASIDVCPIAYPRTHLRVSACARVEGGVLASRGINVQPTRSDVAGWFAMGAVLRARWVIVAPLALELEGALRFPLLRDRFYFEPSRTIFEVPALTWGAAAGVSVSFW